MKKAFFPLLFSLLAFSVHAQIFNNTYDVVKQTYSQQSSMVIDPDGSTVTLQTIREFNFSATYNAHIIKVDDQGSVLWSKEYGINGLDERANGICQTDDGGYIIVGVQEHTELGYGTWMFRIDNNGDLVWSKWYGNPENFISEGFLATRTFESNENYLVIGTSEYPRRISAFKIDQGGNLQWSYEYYDPNLVSSKYDYVNSLVEDPDKEGYIIAGTEHDYYTGFGSTLDLFTLGINLDGQITRKYRKYDLDYGDNENGVHITRKLDGDGFLMAFGTRAGGVQPGVVSFISTLDLDNNLDPVIANLYATNDTYESHANSIYSDPHGVYAMSGMHYSFNTGIMSPFFLQIEQSGTPIVFRRYNDPKSQRCNFMAQDFTSLHENYVLKTDFQENSTFNVGLIRTEIDGTTDCELTEPVNHYTCEATRVIQPYGRSEFADYVDYDISQWDLNPPAVDCNGAPALQGGNNNNLSFLQDQNSGNPIPSDAVDRNNHDLFAYPSNVDATISEVTLEFHGVKSTELAVLVYDVQGKLVYQTVQDVTAGKNVFTLPQAELALGMNTIVLTDQGQRVANARVIKL